MSIESEGAARCCAFRPSVIEHTELRCQRGGVTRERTPCAARPCYDASVVSLSEADTRAKLIDPALHARGWTENLIRREETAGEIQIVNGQPRKTGGRTDYTLRLPPDDGGQPTVTVAVVEAKPEDYAPGFGLQQGKDYAKRLHVPFVYSSNGHMVVEYDEMTGQTQGPFPIANFPGPEQLRARYEGVKGFELSSNLAHPLHKPYRRGESSRRYYQDAAIRATLEKLATGENRALLTMATGSGKTRVAVQLLRKFADAGQLRRALFVCDRDELRLQALRALHDEFGAEAAAASTRKPEKNARVLIATYQTLGIADEEGNASFLTRHYPKDYFSHIIIDEAHRSAWKKWSQVLTRNAEAIQIGLTATPREFEYTEQSDEADDDKDVTADNVKYFGEPVYDYTIAQGIEDGYLAAMEIRKSDVFLEGYRESEQVTGLTQEDLAYKPLYDARSGEARSVDDVRPRYDASAFEASLVIPERVSAMCDALFHELLATGGAAQKTIVFCANDAHADAVANEMNNRYANWCEETGAERKQDYAFKCTAAAHDNHLAEFRENQARYFIATTVELLTTGVDVPAVRNIVFFKYVKSPISFYQMVGRGTRLDRATEKLLFRVYDYTDATRLFGADFKQRFAPVKPDDDTGGGTHEPRQSIVVEGIAAEVTSGGTYVLTRGDDGTERPMPLEEYTERLAAKLVEDIPVLDAFRETWVDPPQRQAMLARLPDAGRSPYLVRRLTLGDDYDLYDVLAGAAYGQAPKTRVDRADAFTWKNRDWLDGMPEDTSRTVQAIASQFARGGTENLESPQIFSTPEVQQAGGLSSLREYGEPRETVRQTKMRVFEA